jgi:hypothetical protein
MDLRTKHIDRFGSKTVPTPLKWDVCFTHNASRHWSASLSIAAPPATQTRVFRSAKYPDQYRLPHCPNFIGGHWGAGLIPCGRVENPV